LNFSTPALRYVKFAIDCFSKYVWMTPLKTKNSIDVSTAMENVLLRVKPPPKNLQSDNGKEFFNTKFQSLMKKRKINHYSTFSSIKASIVERVNRTLKQLLWVQFSFQGNYKWVNILDKIVNQYNNKYHSTIKTTPANVKKSNERSISKSIYTHIKLANVHNKFSVGDHVRISKHRQIFDNFYRANWSNEIFIVKKVKLTNPTTYLLKDVQGEDILGGFYEEELQKVKHSDIYRWKNFKKKREKIVCQVVRTKQYTQHLD
jgi:hypothetical protein